MVRCTFIVEMRDRVSDQVNVPRWLAFHRSDAVRFRLGEEREAAGAQRASKPWPAELNPERRPEFDRWQIRNQRLRVRSALVSW
jgi:hypothetical protein